MSLGRVLDVLEIPCYNTNDYRSFYHQAGKEEENDHHLLDGLLWGKTSDPRMVKQLLMLLLS